MWVHGSYCAPRIFITTHLARRSVDIYMYTKTSGSVIARLGRVLDIYTSPLPGTHGKVIISAYACSVYILSLPIKRGCNPALLRVVKQRWRVIAPHQGARGALAKKDIPRMVYINLLGCVCVFLGGTLSLHTRTHWSFFVYLINDAREGSLCCCWGFDTKLPKKAGIYTRPASSPFTVVCV